VKKLPTHRKYFNQLAIDWDSLVSFEPVLIDYLRQFGVSNRNQILDIGAGTGRLTKLLSEMVDKGGFIFALDFAERMLQKAKQKIKTQNVEFICADVCELPFIDEYFDKVICFSTFPHILDKEKSLREMFRVLRRNGKLLILHTQSSQILNKFHGSLTSIVQHDYIPPADEMPDILKNLGFKPMNIFEESNLYWVEAIK
jgi:ubiquinone/menaquinone biosynthesis C-methylase UbiE